MKKYLFLFLSILITGFAKALPFITQFGITNVNDAGQFQPAGFGVATSFSASLMIQRSINCAAPANLENVDMRLVLVFSSSGNPADPLNVPLADTIRITTASFIGTTTNLITFNAQLPPVTRKGKIMLISKTYAYLNGIRQATPVTGFSTQQYTVPSYLPDNAILIVPDVRTWSEYQSEKGTPPTCTRCVATPSAFDAPLDHALTGKSNVSGRQGLTKYQSASLKAIDGYGNRLEGTITIRFIGRHNTPGATSSDGAPFQNDSVNLFTAPDNFIATGRKHVGDATRQMSMTFGYVEFNGQPTRVLQLPGQKVTMADGTFGGYATGQDQIMTTVQTAYLSGFLMTTHTPGVIYYVPNDSVATRMAADRTTLAPAPVIAMATPEKKIADGVKLYPNPVRNVFNITGLSSQQSLVTIIDAKGNTFKQFTVSQSKVTIDLSAAPAGIYFVKIEQKDGASITKKLVKQ